MAKKHHGAGNSQNAQWMKRILTLMITMTLNKGMVELSEISTLTTT